MATFERTDSIEEARRIIERDLDDKIKRSEDLLERRKELLELVSISIAALRDTHPALASYINEKAEKLGAK